MSNTPLVTLLGEPAITPTNTDVSHVRGIQRRNDQRPRTARRSPTTRPMNPSVISALPPFGEKLGPIE